MYVFLIKTYLKSHKSLQPLNNGAYIYTIQCYMTIIHFIIYTNHNHSMVLANDMQSNYSTNINLSTFKELPSTSYHRFEQVVSMKPLLLSVPLSSSSASASVSSAQQSTQLRKNIISDLISDFKLQLRSIEDQELLVTTIQNGFDSFDRIMSPTEHNDTKFLSQLASKMETKLSNALRIVNQTSHTIQNVLLDETSENSRNLYLESITLPCATTKLTERSAVISENSTESKKLLSGDFFSDINKPKKIEILNFLKNAGHLHETDDKNFTINKQLMETLRHIDLSSANVPNFRDVFFVAKDNYASITKCRNTFSIEHYK